MRRAFLQLHIAVFLAGFTAVLGRLIELNESLLVWYRLLITLAALVIIMTIRKEWRRHAGRSLIKPFMTGCVIAFHWVMFYGAVKYGSISVALVTLSAAGFFSALLEPVLLEKQLVWQELVLGLIAVGGIYIIFDFHPQFKLGIIYGILSALGSAIFPILNKTLVEKFKPRELTFYELTGGFIFLSAVLPFYLSMDMPAGVDTAVQQKLIPAITDWAWLVVLALVCTVLCFDLQLRALRKISAFTCNLMYNLEPLYGIVLAFLFFDENQLFRSEFYIGLALILAVIFIQMLRLRKNRGNTA